MAEQFLEYGVLNIVAHPHGDGVYRSILGAAANREVNFWGDLNAAIRPPEEVGRGIFQGAIVIGTEIDLGEPLIDRSSYEETTPEEADVRISNEHLYNGRVFLYTFVEDRHLLFFEAKNEFGKRLSPNRAHRIFTMLFSADVLGAAAPAVDVTVVPEVDALDRVLGLKRLDRVEIVVQRPNPADVNDDEVQRVLATLEEQGAKSQDVTLARAPGAESITLNTLNYLFARVAQFNGFVSSAGISNDGERFIGSTKLYPKIVRATFDATTNLRQLAARIARGTGIGGPPQANGD